jgi:hypothetical protein
MAELEQLREDWKIERALLEAEEVARGKVGREEPEMDVPVVVVDLLDDYREGDHVVLKDEFVTVDGPPQLMD